MRKAAFPLPWAAVCWGHLRENQQICSVLSPSVVAVRSGGCHAAMVFTNWGWDCAASGLRVVWTPEHGDNDGDVPGTCPWQEISLHCGQFAVIQTKTPLLNIAECIFGAGQPLQVHHLDREVLQPHCIRLQLLHAWGHYHSSSCSVPHWLSLRKSFMREWSHCWSSALGIAVSWIGFSCMLKNASFCAAAAGVRRKSNTFFWIKYCKISQPRLCDYWTSYCLWSKGYYCQLWCLIFFPFNQCLFIYLIEV